MPLAGRWPSRALVQAQNGVLVTAHDQATPSAADSDYGHNVDGFAGCGPKGRALAPPASPRFARRRRCRAALPSCLLFDFGDADGTVSDERGP